MRPYRILLVESDPLSRESVRLLLGAAGMTVQTVADPCTTPDALRSFLPDVLVLAMRMPQCGGAELAAMLREDDAYAELPILFLTTDAEAYFRKRGFKPIEREKIHPSLLASRELQDACPESATCMRLVMLT